MGSNGFPMPKVDLMAAEDAEKRALNRAIEIIEYSLRAVTPKFAERQFYTNMYHNYDEVLKQKQWWQTKFAHPFPFFTIEMKASFSYEGVFGQNSPGLWQVQPTTDVSFMQAENATKLLRYQLIDQSNFVRTFYLGSKSLYYLGDWINELYWDRQERVVQQPSQLKIGMDGIISRPVLGPAGQITSGTPGAYEPFKLSSSLQSGGKKTVVDKNQPDACALYLNSVWPDDKATMIGPRARTICIRRELTFNEIKRRALQEGRYILRNVEKIKDTRMPAMPSNYYDTQLYSPYYRSTNNSSVKGSSYPLDTEDPIVEVIDILYPSTGEVESIANRSVYLGRTIPFPNVPCPLVHIKNIEEQGKLWGASDFRAIAAHWKLINQYQGLEGDNVLFHFRGYTKIARDSGPGVAEAFESLRPGSTISMNNIGGASHDRPDLFSPQVYQSKNQLISDAQAPMGMNEILSGAQPSSNVRTEGQFNQLANFGGKILSQSIRNIGQGLKELGQKWLIMNYDLMDIEQIVPIVGESGLESMKIRPGDIPVTSNLSVRLSADLESQKAQKLQQMLQAINFASASAPGFATTRAIKDWFRQQGSFDDPDRYFLLSDEQAAAMTLSQFGVGGQGGGVPQEPGLAGAIQPPNPAQVGQGGANGG